LGTASSRLLKGRGGEREVISQKFYARIIPKKGENISVKCADLQFFFHTWLTILVIKIAIS